MIAAIPLLLGCWIYSALAIVAAFRHRSQTHPYAPKNLTGISILKPLAGLDEGLEDNLRSYFSQDYGNFELLFAVRHSTDLAAEVVRRLMAHYPAVEARLIITGEPPYPHDKVFKLQRMLDLSKHELVVMCDSDVRVTRDFCRSIAAEFNDQRLALATCPYRGLAGKSLWSRLEAMSMNIDFHAGLFTAVLLEGARFAVGPTIVARKSLLVALGGIDRFKDYLSSEDFKLGRTAAERGFGVRMSSYVVEHRIGSESMQQNFSHRLRWARTSRRSRPWGYLGQFFTYPAVAALLISFAGPEWKLLLGVTTVLRVGVAWAVSQKVLGARVPWLLLPVQDTLNFCFWIAGFFGNTVHWRGHTYVLKPDGTLRLAN